MKPTMLLIAQTGFIIVTLIYFALLFKELKQGINQTSWDSSRKKNLGNRIVLVLILWTAFVSIWSLSGIMSDFTKFPLNLMPVVAIPLITIILLLFSKSLSEILQHIPPANLIRLQSFRIFVELLLWILFIDNILPIQMTFEGMNFDILAGLTAPIIAWLVARNKISKSMLVIWNIICLGLLINIVSIAILSTPSSLRVFMNEPSNTIVAYFPVSFLPGLLVPLAYTLHFLSLKQLSLPTSETASLLKEIK